ncbi:arrestin domain-containing protein 3-like [Centroberyx affinis]|uniref:arrestin domain-containing protein 3-like n=1 Tax=Centroberyx affinis TaxID=166261 RepID=UPI003A5BDAE1
MFQQTFKNFIINFNALNERNTVSSGDLVTGQIFFDLTKPTNISSITLVLKGNARVHWSTRGGEGRNRRRNGKHYSAKLEFLNFKSYIMRGNGAIGGPSKLQPGTHVYPFTCQLPQGNFPSSFEGVHGHIIYTMTVGISRPWHLSKDFVTQLNFVNRIDANQPELLAPLAGSNSMTLCGLWCASGPVSMTVRLGKKVFAPGETAKITCEFSNASSRTATPKARLVQNQTFYTLNKDHSAKNTESLVSETGQPVRPHSSDVCTEMTLAVPAAVPLTVSNCSIIQVDYVIEVRLCVRASSDLVVLFPIILCDIPAYTDPPSYS